MSRRDGVYRGESADEWIGITCPEDCEPLESRYAADEDYNAELDTERAPKVEYPPIYWAHVNGSQHLQRVSAAQYAQIYGEKQ
jgi:hypothetical protein